MANSTTEQSPYGSRRREEQEFNLREWASRAQSVVRTPNQEGFQDRISEVSEKMQGLLDQALPSLAPLHLLAILSKVSYFLCICSSFLVSIFQAKPTSVVLVLFSEEIDPSTYSFTTALKALQARAVYNSWDCLSPDGFALNSKWNDAEKYICNPLSGEVPVECLSAKTLSGRSFRNPANRITMSAHLVYSSHSKKVHTKPSVATPDDCVQFPLQEKKMEGMTRDVGTQSTPPDLSSSSPSPTSTPPITERSFKRCEAVGDSPKCNDKLRAEGKQQHAGWVLVMDEKKATKETQNKKEEYLSS
ncbi:hypothetical protein GH714_032272 [Hevea brasiliensis]|uniref:Uncharacterized protein n=1 Tax=Hevea brasiliensis TaxID=3981 RepID=A0A6A6LIQ1_HEVBR|nr:hypothetical protein GH714_032272 [Hevea brasiliensis]